MAAKCSHRALGAQSVRSAPRSAHHKPLHRPLFLEPLEARLALATALPLGFQETPITTATNLNRPTAMEFSPTGQLWVLEQGGAVKVVDLATGNTTTAGTLTVNSSGERGLLGIAFPSSYDGGGPNADFVYLYYTATTPNIHNRVSQFLVNNAGTMAPTLGVETVRLDIEPEPQGDNSSNHNGGAIHFGDDGMLYIAVGDHNADGASFLGANHVSQRLDSRHGKILRIRPDGSSPSDNPFYVGGNPIRDSIYALGLRNPYTFAFQPGTSRMFINDVGEGAWEEINDGIGGSNFGWASEGTSGFAEGFESSPPSYATVGTYRNPLMAYDHSSSPPTPAGVAITGGVFYPAGSSFGAAYGGKYLFADVGGNFIRVFDPANPGTLATPDTSTSFASNLTTGGPVDLKLDAAGNLYYLAGAGTANGEIYRISFIAPTITQQPGDATINAGQSATFTVAASGGAPLSYQWQRADASSPTTFVNIPGATAASYHVTSTTAADSGDRFRCVVANSAGSATSTTATLVVNGGGSAQNEDEPYDVNANGSVDILDLVDLIGMLVTFGPGPAPVPQPDDDPKFYSDINGDGALNTLDLIDLIGALVSGAAAAPVEVADEPSPADIQEDAADVAQGDEVVLFLASDRERRRT
jgi:predicted outer membrane repeat protein